MRVRVLLFGCCVVVSSGSANATNAEFQDFFFDVCNNPTGELRSRCAETDDAEGDLSGDSESSLNPSQALSGNDAGLAMARSKSQQNREQNEQLRNDEELPGQGRVDIGPFSLLVSGSFGNEEADRKQDKENERGFDADTWSIDVGLDHRFSDQFVMGAMVAYQETDLEFDQENEGRNFTPASEAGSQDSETWSFSVFGSYNFSESLFIDGSAGISSAEYDFERRSVFQESGRTVPQTDSLTRGDADGDDYWLSGNIGYYINRGAWDFTPYAGLTWSRSSVDSYTEDDISQSGLNMRFSSVERDSLLGTLGVSISAALNQDFGVLLPQLRLEYEYEFDRDAETVTAFYLQDAAQTRFQFAGDDPDEVSYNVGVGLVAILPNGWLPYIDYEQQFGNDTYESWRFTFGLRKEL